MLACKYAANQANETTWDSLRSRNRRTPSPHCPIAPTALVTHTANVKQSQMELQSKKYI